MDGIPEEVRYNQDDVPYEEELGMGMGTVNFCQGEETELIVECDNPNHQSFNHSIIQSFNHSIIQASNHQSFIHSIIQSIKQASKQSLTTSNRLLIIQLISSTVTTDKYILDLILKYCSFSLSLQRNRTNGNFYT